MSKSVNRPECGSLEEPSVAIDEALQRAEHISEFSKDGLDGVAGGILGSRLIYTNPYRTRIANKTAIGLG
jgi:hypothetical protein